MALSPTITTLLTPSLNNRPNIPWATAKDLEKWKPQILELQPLKLSHVMQIMDSKGVKATENQFKRFFKKHGSNKNLRRKEMNAVTMLAVQRARLGPGPIEFELHDRRICQKTIVNYWKQKGMTIQEAMAQMPTDVEIPTGLRCLAGRTSLSYVRCPDDYAWLEKVLSAIRAGYGQGLNILELTPSIVQAIVSNSQIVSASPGPIYPHIGYSTPTEKPLPPAFRGDEIFALYQLLEIYPRESANEHTVRTYQKMAGKMAVAVRDTTTFSILQSLANLEPDRARYNVQLILGQFLRLAMEYMGEFHNITLDLALGLARKSENKSATRNIMRSLFRRFNALPTMCEDLAYSVSELAYAQDWVLGIACAMRIFERYTVDSSADTEAEVMVTLAYFAFLGGFDDHLIIETLKTSVVASYGTQGTFAYYLYFVSGSFGVRLRERQEKHVILERLRKTPLKSPDTIYEAFHNAHRLCCLHRIESSICYHESFIKSSVEATLAMWHEALQNSPLPECQAILQDSWTFDADTVCPSFNTDPIPIIRALAPEAADALLYLT